MRGVLALTILIASARRVLCASKATTARLDDVSRFGPVPLGPGKPFVAQTYKPGTVQSGVPARELAERAGHSRPSMSLDVYSHVMPPDEASSERLQRLLR
jgi:hypothetical protein